MTLKGAPRYAKISLFSLCCKKPILFFIFLQTYTTFRILSTEKRSISGSSVSFNWTVRKLSVSMDDTPLIVSRYDTYARPTYYELSSFHQQFHYSSSTTTLGYTTTSNEIPTVTFVKPTDKYNTQLPRVVDATSRLHQHIITTTLSSFNKSTSKRRLHSIINYDLQTTNEEWQRKLPHRTTTTKTNKAITPCL